MSFAVGKNIIAAYHSLLELNSCSLAAVSKAAATRLLSSGSIAVHISPSGQDLVVVSQLGLLFYVSNFAERANLEDRIHTVSLGLMPCIWHMMAKGLSCA